MPEFLEGASLWLVIPFLFVVVFCRSHGTYWLGRGIAAGALRSRWADKFAGPRISRGKAAIARWGWPIVPFSYLTIGFQTAVMASAGLVQMRYWKFLLASLPGCLAWAVIYGVGGLAVFFGGVQLALHSPWLLVAALAVAVAVIGIVVWRRHATRPTTSPLEPLHTPATADEPA